MHSYHSCSSGEQVISATGSPLRQRFCAQDHVLAHRYCPTSPASPRFCPQPHVCPGHPPGVPPGGFALWAQWVSNLRSFPSFHPAVPSSPQETSTASTSLGCEVAGVHRATCLGNPTPTPQNTMAGERRRRTPEKKEKRQKVVLNIKV